MKRWYLFLFLFTLLYGCKKYPDGPGLTFRTPLQRILGTWKAAAYFVNDVDSIFFFNQYESGLQIGFGSEENEEGYKGHVRCGSDSSDAYYATLYWKFVNDKDDLQLDNQHQNDLIDFGGPLAEKDATVYRILRLTHDELWFETDYNDRHYEFRWKKS